MKLILFGLLIIWWILLLQSAVIIDVLSNLTHCNLQRDARVAAVCLREKPWSKCRSSRSFEDFDTPKYMFADRSRVSEWLTRVLIGTPTENSYYSACCDLLLWDVVRHGCGDMCKNATLWSLAASVECGCCPTRQELEWTDDNLIKIGLINYVQVWKSSQSSCWNSNVDSWHPTWHFAREIFPTFAETTPKCGAISLPVASSFHPGMPQQAAIEAGAASLTAREARPAKWADLKAHSEKFVFGQSFDGVYQFWIVS